MTQDYYKLRVPEHRLKNGNAIFTLLIRLLKNLLRAHALLVFSYLLNITQICYPFVIHLLRVIKLTSGLLF